jgi:hypothetical protein
MRTHLQFNCATPHEASIASTVESGVQFRFDVDAGDSDKRLPVNPSGAETRHNNVLFRELCQ